MEENIVEDQDQEVSENTSDTSQEQSETKDVDSEVESKTYNVLGRELSSDELYDEYTKTQSHITRLQQDAATRETKVQEEAVSAVSQNELLQNVPSDVRETITRIVLPVIQDSLRQRDEVAAKEAQDRELRQSFTNAEMKYDGKDGYPKFNRNQVTSFMVESQVYDPEKAYLLMNQASIIDAEIRKALKGKAPSTESTTGSTPRKPTGKTPKTFEEASKRAASR